MSIKSRSKKVLRVRALNIWERSEMWAREKSKRSLKGVASNVKWEKLECELECEIFLLFCSRLARVSAPCVVMSADVNFVDTRGWKKNSFRDDKFIEKFLLSFLIFLNSFLLILNFQLCKFYKKNFPGDFLSFSFLFTQNFFFCFSHLRAEIFF